MYCLNAMKTLVCVALLSVFLALAMARSTQNSTGRPSKRMRCDYYNRTRCLATGKGCGEVAETCRQDDGNEKTSLCYALWHNTASGFVPEFKGCWVGSVRDCSHGSSCVEHRRETKKQLFFCCCEGDLCNTNITHIPLSPPLNNTTGTKEATTSPSESSLLPTTSSSSAAFVTLITIVPLISIVVLLGAGYSFHRCRQKSRFNEVPTNDPLINDYCPPSPYVGLRPIKLQEAKAQGKFGSVWRAKDGSDNIVAVKIFTLQDRSSWQTEQEVYRLPQMKHENILAYMGSEKRGDSLHTEYWLITEYHSHGSLWDYLKANTVNWNQLLTIAQGIVRGLTHLHEEMPPLTSSAYSCANGGLSNGGGGAGFKPSVAHRDFKSKNVLIKSDMTACIADFGLALVFWCPKSTCGEAHGQVGTRRYMAPEVLEGAINHSPDYFMRIDMYACGLVLWELMSRCSAPEVGQCGEYQLPFEEEVGLNPSLEDMQEIVAQQKKRPRLRDAWYQHLGMKALCHTIDDCWDHDAEARLTASCVGERIDALMGPEFVVNLQNSINYKMSYAKSAVNHNNGSLIMRETST